MAELPPPPPLLRPAGERGRLYLRPRRRWQRRRAAGWRRRAARGRHGGPGVSSSSNISTAGITSTMTVALAAAAVHLPPFRVTEVGDPWLIGNPTEARMILPTGAAAVTRELRRPTLRRRCWRGIEGGARQRTLMRKRTPTEPENGRRRSLPRPHSRDWTARKELNDSTWKLPHDMIFVLFFFTKRTLVLAVGGRELEATKSVLRLRCACVVILLVMSR